MSSPRQISVVSNIFNITQIPKATFWQYQEFDPEIKISRRRIDLIHKLQTEIQPTVFQPRAMYDGRTIMFSPRVLPLPGQGSGTFEVPGGGRQSTAIKIRITQVGTAPIDFSAIRALLSGKALGAGAVAAELNVLQLLLRQVPSETYTQKGKSFFSPQGGEDLRNGITILRGFFQSIRPAPGRLVVNVDVSAGTFYTPGNLFNVVMSVLGFRDARFLDKLSPDQMRALLSHLKNVRIYVKSDPKRPRIQTIRALEPQAGLFRFLADGHETTVKDYYKSAYGTTLQYPRAVGLNMSGKNSDNPTIVPLEICEILPGQVYKKKLPPHLTDQMVRFTTLRPKDRMNMITRSTQGGGTVSPILQYANSDYLQSSGMQISPEPATIQGAILPPPPLAHAGGSIKVDRGAWNAMGKTFHQPATISAWLVLNFDSSFPEREVTRIVTELRSCCITLGMSINQPFFEYNGNAQVPAQTLRQLKEKLPGPPELIVAILPKEATDIRAAVKMFGDVQTGIRTQCMRSDKLRKANNQYFNNVAIKLNARFGKVNFATTLTPLKSIPGPYMIIGIDVSHPGPGVIDRPSIASVVFSVDQSASIYRARIRVQPPRTEAIQSADLQAMVADAVDVFGSMNKVAPSHIIVFRDGLSEGEYENVAGKECKAIQEIVPQVVLKMTKKASPPPKVTFIVVTKRHHVRFFPKSSNDEDKSGNCPPGFTTGEALSSPGTREFYLQSHAGLLGTSRPSHYIVLYDEIFTAPNGLQLLQVLAYGLCHVYAKATRSVSIPAPVYYADLACARAGFYFSPEARFSAESVSDGTAASFDLQWWHGQMGRVRDRDNNFFFL